MMRRGPGGKTFQSVYSEDSGALKIKTTPNDSLLCS